MSDSSESRQSFDDLAADLTAAGFRLDWVDEGPVRGEPMFAAFAHPDGRRIRLSQDLLTGVIRLEEVAAPAQIEAAAFSAFGVETRRQILRWWLVRRTPLTERVEAVLAAALMDTDPETRVTAVLCALRIRAFSLVENVRTAEIPATSADGAFPGDRLLYRRIQQVAVEALSGRGGDRASALFAVLAEPIERPEALLMHALCTPLPEVEAPAGNLPDGVGIEDATLRLTALGTELVWIPPVGHWRGGLRPADGAEARPRQEVPPTPLLITKHVLTTPELKALGASSADGLLTASEASALVVASAELLGPGVGLADPAAWSMALHGPDGRLFPWGNALAPAQRTGPWGVYWSEAPEWTMARGELQLRAVRPHPSGRGSVRLMVVAREAAS